MAKKDERDDVWSLIERDWANLDLRIDLATRLRDAVRGGKGADVASALDRLVTWGLATPTKAAAAMNWRQG